MMTMRAADAGGADGCLLTAGDVDADRLPRRCRNH